MAVNSFDGIDYFSGPGKMDRSGASGGEFIGSFFGPVEAKRGRKIGEKILPNKYLDALKIPQPEQVDLSQDAKNIMSGFLQRAKEKQDYEKQSQIASEEAQQAADPFLKAKDSLSLGGDVQKAEALGGLSNKRYADALRNIRLGAKESALTYGSNLGNILQARAQETQNRINYENSLNNYRRIRQNERNKVVGSLFQVVGTVAGSYFGGGAGGKAGGAAGGAVGQQFAPQQETGNYQGQQSAYNTATGYNGYGGYA